MEEIRQQFESNIMRWLDSDFERELLKAAFDNLLIPGPIRFNNFAYAMREIIRHLTHRLAPEEQIKKCKWFKPEPNSSNGISRAHRIRYAIQGGLSDYYLKNILEVDNIGPTIKELVKANESLSKYTHIGETTFGMPDDDVKRLAIECLKAVNYFTRHIEECRCSIIEVLATRIDDHVVNQVISETISSIDELSTHHWVEEVDVSASEVSYIGPESITVISKGTVGIELQYGSNSDLRSDMGVTISDSFPFEAELLFELKQPIEQHGSVSNFGVNTDSFYGYDS
ncbi:hypothetical protein [Oceanospirillum beijerinckii]|uniref:pPIWI-associating nuclease domain-containing protein n=1 Tax=Oceanospirillum beijerinckii TaxID=64976 RepID=UPI000426D9BF|nr:hypothetical protein [Oceanospirillum beijerinckii]